jgi:tetratricopeptide (TPR) repeat protein
LQPAPAITRSTFGRTLRVAGWTLAVTAVAEIAAAGFAMMDRAHSVPPLSIQVPPISVTDTGVQPLPAHPAPAFNDPFASAASNTPAPAATPAAPPLLAQATAPETEAPAASTPAPAPALGSLPKPTPVDETQVAPPESRVNALMAEAAALSQRGDTSTAVTRLREALAMAPKNPQVIEQLAVTYEKMDLEDKALEQWRALYDMGESAGLYYTLADAKLKTAELSQGAAEPSPSAADTGTTDVEGFQEGSVLALTNLSTDEKPEATDGLKRFTLKIPVKRRPDVKIDVEGVVIQVFFYDQLADQTVVRTNAMVNDHWNTLPADWVQDDVEILDVDYTQASAEPGALEAGRHYYGYVVCVYYNKQLQDEAADPVSLIKTYPPPLTLQEK